MAILSCYCIQIIFSHQLDLIEVIALDSEPIYGKGDFIPDRRDNTKQTVTPPATFLDFTQPGIP